MGKATTILAALRRPSEARALVNYTVWRDPLHRIEDNPESGWDREEMKQCWGFLDATSRSFAAVIKELEGDLSRVIALFYLILRGLDTIEDDMTLDIDTKVPLLVNFHERLEEDGWNFTESGPNEKDRALLVDFQVVIAEYKRLGPESVPIDPSHSVRGRMLTLGPTYTFRISYKKAIVDITQKMGAGMARYAKVHAESGGKFSVDTLASFDLYCHFVAGLVGEGLSRLFSASGKGAPELGQQVSLSNSMGLLLQKTNILRDFREDTDEGRVFWPAELWSKYVDKPEHLYARGNEQKALWALSEMTVDALTHATDALDYLTLLSNQSVFNFCAIPQAMAMATLHECFMNPKVFHQNVKIRKGLAVRLILDATNPRDVAYMFRDMARAIHAKAVSNDPSFIKIAVLAGRIEQWAETRYPSFIEVGKPVPKSTEDWRPGMDSRVRQLAPTEAILAERKERAAVMEATKMSNDDYKFLALLLGGIVLLFLVLAAIGGGMMWWFFFREGARFAEDVLGDPEEIAARAKEILHPEF
ncbi:BQ2448_517 [Microbotryum intermedium]|uniref:Squalene synthase n=1 Tax=Microbotryum intermedium TaxID=269621 RepID=A0A238FBE3_9BASI|nr:BQ2448_517 [Microbotryum intermedium]